MEKYHVALSFAGEDRDYVDRVAQRLQENSVKVFYDKFEETNLWGKDLYAYLSDVYQNQASFTVMFISENYRLKMWTNHERTNAQARAFSENREYILPAFFDTSIEVPGVPKTTGYVDLLKLTPDDFADKIIAKLMQSDVLLASKVHYSYAEAARVDVDFPIKTDDEVSEIITDLRSYNWYTQSPAIEKIFQLNWNKRTPDEAFVLGRNIYQCADGGERRAQVIMKDLRRELAKIPDDWAEHILNGMFYEAYFNHEGKFRDSKLKSRFLPHLFAVESVARFEKSIAFIQHALNPYRGSLGVLPNTTPEVLKVWLKIEEKDPPVVSSIQAYGKEQLVMIAEDDPGWQFSSRGITLEDYPEVLMKFWNIPEGHMEICYDRDLPSSTKLHVPNGKTLGALKA